MGDLVDPPEAGDDVRELWQVVAKIARIVNALARLKVTWSQVRDRLSLNEGSATLELKSPAGTGGVETLVLDFTCSDAGGGKIQISNGTVDGLLPTGPVVDGVPTGMAAGGSPAFKIAAVSGPGFVWLAVSYTVNTSSPFYTNTGVVIGTGTTVPSSTGTVTTGGTVCFSICDYDYDPSTGKVLVGSGSNGSGSKQTQWCAGTILMGSI